MARKMGPSVKPQTPPDAPGVLSNVPNTNSPTVKRKRSKKKIDWDRAEQRTGLKYGFQVTRLSSSRTPTQPKKKRKLIAATGIPVDGVSEQESKIQLSPFENSELGDFYYSVKPRDLWEAATPAVTVVVEDETFSQGEYVYIKAGEDKAAAVSGWIGKILEIRFGDEAHVYVRIYWMYRPEDLPEGRQPYHGTNELIASNDMAIVEAQTIESEANVTHWDDDADPTEELFWRQTLDVSDGQRTLSDLPKVCVDKTPLNPEQVIIQCDNCETWLHSSCLEADAVRKAYEAHELSYPEAAGQPNVANSGKQRSSAKGKAKETTKRLLFTAELSITDEASLIVVDKRAGHGHQSTEKQVHCLACHDLVDQGKHPNRTDISTSIFGSDGSENEEADELETNGADELEYEEADELEPNEADEFQIDRHESDPETEVTDSDFETANDVSTPHTFSQVRHGPIASTPTSEASAEV